MRKFKEFLYDSIGVDDIENTNDHWEDIQEEKERNIINENPIGVSWNMGDKFVMTSCKNGHFTFSYI